MWQLELERFCWPGSQESVVVLNGQELNCLLDGLDLRFWPPHVALRYDVA